MSRQPAASWPKRIALWFSGVLLLIALSSPFALFYLAEWYYAPSLPAVASLRDLKLQVPLRIFTSDGKLIGEFGAERRAPLRFDQLPQRVIDAFLAAEDDRFFEHPGVDWRGLLRASFKLASTGEKSQGGSTITMQLARNVFLTPERSYERKIREILLALRIEREMSKTEILETYLNKIFLGQRAYGVGAASQVYFGHEPASLTWGEAALLAGLPKAPSRDNPIAAPERAKDRRDYVLRRLRHLGKISELDLQAALARPVEVKPSAPQVQTDAHFVAEMVRAELVAKYGESAYTAGYQVTATVSSVRQNAANLALRKALLAYDERHGWRGPESRLPAELLSEAGGRRAAIDDLLSRRPAAAGLEAAVVVEARSEHLTVLRAGQRLLRLEAEDFGWARISPRKPLAVGDIIRVRAVGERWRLAQIPEVQGALVALDPRTGAVESVMGGYDFVYNKYNRALQAQRQPGSGFKPFLYAAAFEQGFTPASVVLDAPVVFQDSQLEGAWRPENFGGDFKGPMRLREALVHSRNLVSIRLLQELGVERVRNYAARFGLDRKRMPRDLSMALGTGSFTPMEIARGYAILANGGYRVEPYIIQSIIDGTGNAIFTATAPTFCDDCNPADLALPPGTAPRVAQAAAVWLVDDILREVTVRGTAAEARKLGRRDIAGKTGTTNDETDAWFNGFNGNLVAVVWVGFDQPAPLGKGEVGGSAALPMWMDYMRVALRDQPETTRPRPAGLVNLRIDRKTGLLASGGNPNAIFEVVPQNRVPAADKRESSTTAPAEDLF